MRRLGIFAMPTSKRKLTIDQAEAALKQRGYTLDFRSGQTNPPTWQTSYEVKQPNGVVKRMTVDQIKALMQRSRFDSNCGIGKGGFKPGNTCGAESGGGGGSSSKPSDTVRGIEDRAKAAGKSFTEQWLSETRSDITRTYDQRDAREAKKAAAAIRKKEAELAEVIRKGPQPSAGGLPERAKTIRALEDQLGKAKQDAKTLRKQHDKAKQDQEDLRKRHEAAAKAHDAAMRTMREKRAAQNTPEAKRAADIARSNKQALSMVNRERKQRGLPPLNKLPD